MALRILALETSTRDASVAVLDGEQVLGQASLGRHRRTAETFAQAIAQQLDAVNWRPRDIQLVATTIGPGSFTGLRIGVTAAKSLAYAIGAEVFAVGTLDVIARQTPAEFDRVYPVLDAQRQQLFVAAFCRDTDDWVATSSMQIVDADPWLASLPSGATVIGPGLARLYDRIPAGVRMVCDARWTPRAATVGQLAHRRYLCGERHDLWTLDPQYGRDSAAEEKARAGGEGGRGKGDS